MKNMLAAMSDALARGERVVLCGILAASGSSPREAGAKMAVFTDGTTLGTVGGGAVELASIAQAKELFAHGGTAVRQFALHPDEQDDINMICGGEVTLFFLCFSPEDAALCAALAQWQKWNEEKRTYYLRFTTLAGEQPFRILAPTELLHENLAKETSFWDGRIYLEKVEQAKRVLLFGGGHVGRALVPVLEMVGFRVWVIDERQEIAVQERFPAAEQVLRCSYTDIRTKLTVETEDYVVIMTPGHQADYDLLRQILPTETTYIGCIGSRRKAALAREKLLADGFTEEKIARVHSPIGIAISAQTPEEIAISIAAEMIAHRARNV